MHALTTLGSGSHFSFLGLLHFFSSRRLYRHSTTLLGRWLHGTASFYGLPAVLLRCARFVVGR
jgi:hypothetical protein